MNKIICKASIRKKKKKRKKIYAIDFEQQLGTHNDNSIIHIIIIINVTIVNDFICLSLAHNKIL